MARLVRTVTSIGPILRIAVGCHGGLRFRLKTLLCRHRSLPMCEPNKCEQMQVARDKPTSFSFLLVECHGHRMARCGSNNREIPPMLERAFHADVWKRREIWRGEMNKMKALSILAVSATLAAPAMAQHGIGGGHGGFHGGGGVHGGGAGGMRAGMAAGATSGSFRSAAVGGNFRSAAVGSNFRSAAASGSFRNAQANIGAARSGSFAGRGQFANGYGHGRRLGFGPGVGFAAGLAAGSALGYGYDGYYDGDYAYNDYYGDGDPGYVLSSGDDSDYVVSNADNSGYCAQRYQSYDPASGTYLGYDGQRHPCP
jgi:hypothetical protein